MADRACATLVACERACLPGDDACLHVCELAQPTGVSAARAFGACAQASCAQSCVGPSWRCLEPRSSNDSPPLTPTVAKVRITYRFIDYETEAPIADLAVRACKQTDVECTSPLHETTTGADGTAVLDVSPSALEYAEARSDTYGPVLVFLPPIRGDFAAGTIPIATHAAFLKLAAPIATPDPARGTVLASVKDCTGARAGGVAFALEPADGAAPFYVRGRLPSSVSKATDDDGFGAGGFVNVKANTSITIRASVVENGLAWPEVSVVARPGPGYTHVELYAAPP